MPQFRCGVGGCTHAFDTEAGLNTHIGMMHRVEPRQQQQPQEVEMQPLGPSSSYKNNVTMTLAQWPANG